MRHRRSSPLAAIAAAEVSASLRESSGA